MHTVNMWVYLCFLTKTGSSNTILSCLLFLPDNNTSLISAHISNRVLVNFFGLISFYLEPQSLNFSTLAVHQLGWVLLRQGPWGPYCHYHGCLPPEFLSSIEPLQSCLPPSPLCESVMARILPLAPPPTPSLIQRPPWYLLPSHMLHELDVDFSSFPSPATEGKLSQGLVFACLIH